MKNFLFGKPLNSAVTLIILWALVSYGIFYSTTELTVALLPFIIGFLFVYPLGTFFLCFKYSKNYGYKYYLILPIIAMSLIAYLLLGFDSVEPNFVVMTIIAVLFGSAIGRQFCDENKIITVEDKLIAKKQAKEKAEREYKSIIDDKK